MNAIDKAIRICDASTGRKVVVFAENYLRSLGKNNGVGKYDKIVQGVRSILSQSLLEDDKLEKAVQREVDRLLSLVMYAIISPALCSWKYDTGSVLRWLKRSFRISRSIFLAAPNMQYLHPILPARTNTAITAILTMADAKPDSSMVVYFIPSMTWPTMRGTSVCALSITISIAMPSR